jgi:hypothetical protein
VYYVTINDMSAVERYKRQFPTSEVISRFTPWGVFIIAREWGQASWFIAEGKGLCFTLDGDTPQLFTPTVGMYDQLFLSLRENAGAEVCYG